MFKKTMLAMAALGLTAGAVPAEARTDVYFGINLGKPQYNQDYRYNNDNRYNDYHYNNQYNDYRYYPRCNRWEVLVQDRYGRVFCMDRDDYYDRGRHKGWRDRD